VQVTTQPYILAVRAGFTHDLAASSPSEAPAGDVTYGTPRPPISPLHVEELQIHRRHHWNVPYRGGADVARELAGGRIDAGIISYSSLRPAVERGATLIASTGAERQASVAQIPVIAETYPGYDMSSWTGIFAPAGTPETAQRRITEAAPPRARGAGDPAAAIERRGRPGQSDGCLRRRIERDRAPARASCRRRI